MALIEICYDFCLVGGLLSTLVRTFGWLLVSNFFESAHDNFVFKLKGGRGDGGDGGSVFMCVVCTDCDCNWDDELKCELTVICDRSSHCSNNESRDSFGGKLPADLAGGNKFATKFLKESKCPLLFVAHRCIFKSSSNLNWKHSKQADKVLVFFLPWINIAIPQISYNYSPKL